MSSHSYANLALLGDKFFHFGAGRLSFIMYGMSGRTCVVMGDPVGDPKEFQELLWDFYELARRQGARIVWYEIGSEYLAHYVELGLKFFKIGEEAVVRLNGFTTAGSRGKRLRPPCNKLEKDGYELGIVPHSGLAALLPELRSVSDEWLKEKGSGEKGFSLGFFDETYLGNFDFALVRKEGRIVAFANLWKSGDGKELSIDLMRHRLDAPNGTMEFLFVRLIEWGRDHGFERFNLGMAPLSGMEAREAAPLWNKAVSLIFRTGEGVYNFQGLRAFKDKFGPEWRPRYIVSGGGVSLAVAAADIAFLVSRARK